MPATSKQQQQLFGLALSVKRGETPRSEASDEVLNIVDTMSEKQIEDFASTSHKGLPQKVEQRLREIIREELRSLSENKLQKGDFVKYYDKYKGGKMDWYIVYIDSTHVRVTTDKPTSTSGMVGHIRQLQDRPYYRDMMMWIQSGDRKHIDGKTYSDN